MDLRNRLENTKYDLLVYKLAYDYDQVHWLQSTAMRSV